MNWRVIINDLKNPSDLPNEVTIRVDCGKNKIDGSNQSENAKADSQCDTAFFSKQYYCNYGCTDTDSNVKDSICGLVMIENGIYRIDKLRNRID